MDNIFFINFLVLFFFLMIRRPPSSTLLPYTPLFRSARLRQAPLRGQIALRHERLLALGAGELRELGRNVALVGVEQLATGVDEPLLAPARRGGLLDDQQDRKSTRLNSSHSQISYAVFCLKKKQHGEMLPVSC